MTWISHLLLVVVLMITCNLHVSAQQKHAAAIHEQVVAFAKQLSIDTAKAAEIGRIYRDFQAPISEVLSDTSLKMTDRLSKLKPLLQARQEQLRQLLTESEYMRLSEHYRPRVVDFHAKRDADRAARARINNSSTGN